MTSMLYALVLLPVLAGALAYLLPSDRLRPIVLPLAGAGHLALTTRILVTTGEAGEGEWIALDPLGRLILTLISVLFFLCAIFNVGYLRARVERSNRVFCTCLLLFLGMATLVTASQHLGLMWVAIEATTLATAPLIYFNRTPRSIEATWKYLLICSVGIALALLGLFFLAYGALHEGLDTSLVYGDLLSHAGLLSKPWLRGAFVLLLVGFGTKMGLFPMHTWKPDAYGEAPGVVGALLAGGLTNCAFLALVRIYHLCQVAGEGAWAGKLMVFMGLLSMAFAGAFMVGQRDFKRLLAYSSVEHMGILVLGIGLGGAGFLGAMLHVVNNGLAKGVLFLSAGNIHRAFGSKSTGEVRGVMRLLPVSGTLYLAGFLAITGSPPFGPFISEFTILNAAFEGHRFVVAGLYLLFLMVVFMGMGSTALAVVQGEPPTSLPPGRFREGFLTILPIILLMAMTLLMGLYIPEPVRHLVNDAAAFLEVRS